MPVFSWLARNGRHVLVAGLCVGILFPGAAAIMRPTIGWVIILMLFLAVLRLGPEGLRAGLRGLGEAIGLTFVLQTALPLVATAGFAVFGLLAHPVALGCVLVLCAAPITGSPNLTIMARGDPVPALRQLVIGTALLPLTALPAFLLLPGLGHAGAVAVAAGKLLVLIALAGGVAHMLRHFRIVPGTPRSFAVMDGAAALLLALVVIGLMSAIRPAFANNPGYLGLNLLVVFGLNFGLQISASLLQARRLPRSASPIGIVAGNRNVALFLSVLPSLGTDAMLLFIGCYQIPMYLTPWLMSGWYRRFG